MTAYISISYHKRNALEKEVQMIKETLNECGITPFVFVDTYQFSAQQERPMMQQAMKDLDRCDLLIAETSDKGIGIGIEAGYAKAQRKPVLYLRHKDAEHSTTLSGLSDFGVVYENGTDLKQQLRAALRQAVHLLPTEKQQPRAAQ